MKAEPNCYVYPTSFDDYSLNDPYNSYLYNVNSPVAENIGSDNEASISDATYILRWIAYIDIPHQVVYEKDSSIYYWNL